MASERGRWVAAVLAALLLYLVAFLLQPVITFYDNDDLNIAWALAGYRSGSPSYSHPFLNPITAALVSALYAAVPAVPWWYAVQTFCLLLSAAVVANCTLKLSHKNGLPSLAAVGILAILFSATYYYALSQVTFTLTSALLGTGATALALAVDRDDSPALRRFYWIASVLLMGLSLLIRQSSGLCAACFYFGALAVRLVEALQSKAGACVRRVLTTAAIAALVVAGLTAFNGWGRAHQNPEGFLPFENARAAFMDYPHDAYHENPALYDALGWDAPLYDLVDAWFYMDARVNAETLAAASEGAHAQALTVAERADRGARALAVFLNKYPIARYLCAIAACAGLALVAVALLRRAHWLNVAGGLCMLLGGVALLAYLLYAGRINLRTWMTVAFPAILGLLLLCVRAYGTAQKDTPTAECAIHRRRTGGAADFARLRTIALACICGALAALALGCGYKIFRTVVSYDSREALAKAHAIVDYAVAHPDNVYIRDVYAGNNYDALTVYEKQPPVNLIDWGGCDIGTRARLAQWRVNGYDAPRNADVLFDEAVYYVCDPEQPYLSMLDAYMRAAWDASGYEIVDTLKSGAAIVRFLS